MEKGKTSSHAKISSGVKKAISDNKKVPDIFNDIFVNIVPSVKILPKKNTN